MEGKVYDTASCYDMPGVSWYPWPFVVRLIGFDHEVWGAWGDV